MSHKNSTLTVHPNKTNTHVFKKFIVFIAQHSALFSFYHLIAELLSTLFIFCILMSLLQLNTVKHPNLIRTLQINDNSIHTRGDGLGSAKNYLYVNIYAQCAFIQNLLSTLKNIITHQKIKHIIQKSTNLARQVGPLRDTRTLKRMITMRNLYCTCVIVQSLYHYKINQKISPTTSICTQKYDTIIKNSTLAYLSKQDKWVIPYTLSEGYLLPLLNLCTQLLEQSIYGKPQSESYNHQKFTMLGQCRKKVYCLRCLTLVTVKYGVM